MPDHALDGGDAILEACRGLGVDYIISSPGSDWGSVWEALIRQANDKRRGPAYINCAHELLAVDLAVGYTAMTGRMQALLLHSGVGVMQASMGIYGARVSEIPLLIMSGESTTYGDQQGFDPGQQWYNNHNVAGGLQTFAHPLVKWTHQAGAGGNLYEMVQRTGEIAAAAPAGPAYLDVPLEVMLQPWQPPAMPHAVPAPPRLHPSTADVEKVAAMLLAASNPVIVTASAGRSVESYAALIEVAEALSVPVVESFSGEVNSFPKGHPLHQGFDTDLLRDADLVLVVRSRTPWYPPKGGPLTAKVVVIDEHPFKLHMAYQNLRVDAFLAGDVAPSLKLLAAAVRSGASDGPARGIDTRARAERWASAHEALAQRNRAAVADSAALPGIHAVTLASTLAEILPADTIYVDETTMHLGVNRRHLVHSDAQCYWAMRTGLGQGLGWALGVKLARPDRTVVSLIGDGAFLYNPVLPGLGLAEEASLPILVVIYNNRGYAAMRDSQLAYYPQGLGAMQHTFPGQSLPGFDYETLAGCYGGFGIRVERKEDLKAALIEAHAAVSGGRTAIVNVILTA